MFKKTILACLVAGSLLSGQVSAESISGVVTDSAGKPVAGAKVTVVGENQHAVTDEAGRFSVSQLLMQDAELHIEAPRYAHRNFRFAVPQQGLSDVSLVLLSSTIEVIDVKASPFHASATESALPVSVLAGDALKIRQAATLGDTLKNEVGVHSNFYGGVASSPIIRGLDGPRVRILNNGLDTADVSRVGPDHAITADAITAQQIEVLRGPATLLYGSGAIGGVINVVDNRIPRQLRSSSETKLETRYVDVSDEKTVALNHEGSSDNIAWHFDGFNRDGSDYDVPRFSNDEGESSKTLENSWIQSKAVNGGVSYIGDRGLFGISIGRLESDYGIPGHHHAD